MRSISSRRASTSCSRRLDGAGGYADRSWSGTSMASPHVAGVAALALAAGRATTAAGRDAPAHPNGARPRPAGTRPRLRGRSRARGCRTRSRGTLSACRVARPPVVQIARSQWLLGLDAPESTDEIRRAWKQRVARTHPDRNATRAGAATRVTAAFNQARELCEWWLEAGEAWPKPMPPEALRAPEPERAVRPPARTPEENRSSFRAGDLVVRAVPGRDPALEHVLTIRASAPGEDGRVELDDGSSAAPGRARAGRLWLPGVREVRRAGGRAPRAAPVPRRASRSSFGSSVRSARSSRLCAACARAPAQDALPRRSSAIRARGARARPLPLGGGGRAPSARGAQGPDPRRLRPRLRALGSGLHGARCGQRPRRVELAPAIRRSCRAARRRSSAPR